MYKKLKNRLELECKSYKETRRRKKEAKACNDFRAVMLFFGRNLYDMRDEELLKGIIHATKVFNSAGVSTDAAVEGLSSLVSAMPPLMSFEDASNNFNSALRVLNEQKADEVLGH